VAADAFFEEKRGAEDARIGPGRLVLVVGPSGAGKDAIISVLRARLAENPRFVLPRRVVTRQPNAAEDHVCVSEAEFDARLRGGAFALHWQAHGIRYGIPVEINDAVRGNRWVVFNAARHVVAGVRERYANSSAVLIQAPLAVRAERLAKRGRESAGDVAARLDRAPPGFRAEDADLVIDNAGALESAAENLARWLLGEDPAQAGL
jgi:ribose 1,5-bisphosphokinase